MDDLIGERLRLRRPASEDLAHITALHGNAEVMRMIDDGRPVPADVVRSRDFVTLTRDYGPGRGYWIGVDPAGAFIGWFGLRPRSTDPDVVELGYRLLPEFWGRGIATEGARMLVRHAFDSVGVARVVATTMTVNVGSRRVMEKAGLTWERTFHEEWDEPIDGAEHGDVDYALTAEQWTRGVNR
ncbi:GNAT family N-acetyltransferase [Microbacterium lacus]|uniref:GNAT family N-acetyltransferase n=1 Tax=Microbacterium lacus TaxID=415217 RepID=UPI0038501A67